MYAIDGCVVTSPLLGEVVLVWEYEYIHPVELFDIEYIINTKLKSGNEIFVISFENEYNLTESVTARLVGGIVVEEVVTDKATEPEKNVTLRWEVLEERTMFGGLISELE